MQTYIMDENTLGTAVPFWGRSTYSLTALSPNRDCGSKGVQNHTGNLPPTHALVEKSACSLRIHTLLEICGFWWSRFSLSHTRDVYPVRTNKSKDRSAHGRSTTNTLELIDELRQKILDLAASCCIFFIIVSMYVKNRGWYYLVYYYYGLTINTLSCHDINW